MYQQAQRAGSILLAASYSLKVHAFDINTGAMVDEFDVANSQANRILPLDDKKFAVAAYSYIFTYDFQSKSKKQTQAYIGHEGNVTGLYDAGETLISCGEDKTIKIWDKRTTKPSESIKVGSSLNSIFLMPTGNSIVVCGETGFVSLWDVRTLTCPKKFSVGKVPIRCLSVAQSGNHFVAACQDGSTVAFRITGDDFAEHYRIQSHNETQLRCVVSPDSRFFATTAGDNSARLWALESGEMLQQLRPSDAMDWVWDAAFTADSMGLCTGGSDGCCRVWDVENGRVAVSMPQLEKCVSAVAILDI